MNSGYNLVKIAQFDSVKASIYTVELYDGTTLFDKFLEENKDFREALKDILSTLNVISSKTGARLQYFKENEGVPGDGVCALYDKDKKLRLYCVRYGTDIVLLGGGGPKDASIRALQEDEKLTKENLVIRNISQDITKRMKEKEIFLKEKDFEGDLYFNPNEQ